MTSIVHYTEAAKREIPMNVISIRPQLLRKPLQVFSILALIAVSHQPIMKAERNNLRCFSNVINSSSQKAPRIN